MAIPLTTGLFDITTGGYIPPNTGTWGNLTAWSDWTTWVNEPADSFTVSTEIFDRGQVGKFNLRTETEVFGNITYVVYTSANGAFAGEETISTITANSSNLAAFYGQYYIVQANVASQGGLPQLNSMTITSTDASLDLKLNDIETANLSQTGNGAVISLPRICSAVLNMQITLHDSASFAQDFDTDFSYIEMPTFRMPQPLITGKDRSGPTFVLRDLFFGTQHQANVGHIIDARITVLPEQFHDGTNLATR